MDSVLESKFCLKCHFQLAKNLIMHREILHFVQYDTYLSTIINEIWSKDL